MPYLDTLPHILHGQTARQLSLLTTRLNGPFREMVADLQMAALPNDLLLRFYLPLAAALAKASEIRPTALVVGVNGAQGTGKTTLCRLLTLLLETGFSLRVASFSIDDLYRTHAERILLAQKVHPLLATRGVPGTHDVGMGLQLLKELTNSRAGHQVSLPVFDKSRDDRAPRSTWRWVETPLDIILFEGWCVGARPQPAAALKEPVNTLEVREDPQGSWRSHVNAMLAGDYARLFACLDLLIMLEVPGMDCVYAWRGLQERKLAAQADGMNATKLMDEAALQRFIMHYERLTCHMLDEMPERANLVLRLDRAHQLNGVKINCWPKSFRA